MIQRHKKGFTLVELTLAMAFVSMLLLTITMTAIQAGHIYNRGMVLRTVNQVGRDISDTIRRDFLQTNAAKISVPDGGSDKDPVVVIEDSNDKIGGRFCLGQYSYVWNTASTLDKKDFSNTSVAYTTTTGTDKTPVNLVRVDDKDGQLCQKDVSTSRYPNAIDSAASTQLLKPIDTDDVVIAVHDMSVTRMTDSDSSEQLYRIKFTLGTSATSEIDTLDGTCKPPDDAESNSDFCAINNFDMIVRTNG